jgi:hypothetical protein
MSWIDGNREYSYFLYTHESVIKLTQLPCSSFRNISRSIPLHHLLAIRHLSATTESQEASPHSENTFSRRCFSDRLLIPRGWILAVDGNDGKFQNTVAG